MAVIGVFTPTKEGGWSGTIRTLTINAKVRLVPNDNRESANAPDFRVMAERSEVDAAWRKCTSGEPVRVYLSVRLDDPGLSEPISAAMFEAPDAATAQLVWNRRKVETDPALHSDRTKP